MSRDIEALLRNTARGARPTPALALAAPSDLRRRGDRRRAVRRGGTLMAALAVVGVIAVGVSGLPSRSSAPPASPAPSSSAINPELAQFPVAPTLHNGRPSVPRRTGEGPSEPFPVNLVGTTTTYFTCAGGGNYTITWKDGRDWASGTCDGNVDASTVTNGAEAAEEVMSIRVDPGVPWAVQVVSGTGPPTG